MEPTNRSHPIATKNEHALKYMKILHLLMKI